MYQLCGSVELMQGDPMDIEKSFSNSLYLEQEKREEERLLERSRICLVHNRPALRKGTGLTNLSQWIVKANPIALLLISFAIRW